jgi:hypothetical protein
MATSSKRISQFTLYTNQQFDPAWLTCMIPANFTSVGEPEYPDTFKVPLSSLVMSLRDVSSNGQLTVLKTISAACPVIIGETNNRSGIFIYKGTSPSNSEFFNLQRDSNASSFLTIGVGKSWFFKIFVIGVNSNGNQSTNIEFIGLIRRNLQGNVELVGTTTKIIHSRDDILTDAEILADNSNSKTITIRAKGGTSAIPYSWTARMDIVQA